MRKVEAELNLLTSIGNDLNRASPRASYQPELPTTESRLRLQRELLDKFFEDGQPDVENDGKAIVTFTAGPPGAGKSTAVNDLHLAGDGWRVIDPDDIKLSILEADNRCGVFDDLLSIELPDGHPLMLNELCSLVHDESVFLAGLLLERSLEAQENVVVEGTFSWPRLKEKYMRLLVGNDYRRVNLIDIEVEQEQCLSSAYERWAKGRIDTIEGQITGGGRFTPRDAITSIFTSGQRVSICNRNAVDFFNDPASELFEETNLYVRQARSGQTVARYQREYGSYRTPKPAYLES
ncbi:zeta toxin family protein [Glutamicibacter sp. AOP5-A2-18]|uniref:zeta toxin family protein n=1 Tax=Glutamicibacter sp. AOP5-A2-18 TaxID=3457656 RepID=UPI004033BF7B